ncbi:unnamed protein product [Trichogramma brassicae]|uniref:Uncharacterized protein n=1 Tax=Trichogramma brassicae TaxID=86971 RepID=A0A6H5HT58_9HYME|nr:unnamed protein product [Trichogramma brassicae]
MFLCTCLFKPLATIDDESDAKFDIVLRDLGKSKSSRDNGDRETEEGEKSKSSRENNNCKIEEEEESAKSSRENNNCKTEEEEESTKSLRENNNCKTDEEEESAKSSMRENKNCKTEEEVSAKSSRENEDCKIEEEEQKSIDFSLHSAIKRGLMHEMEILLRVGADPNSANDQKSTPLHLICANDVGLMQNFLDTCKNIKTPVQVNAQDSEDKTPLHIALVRVKGKYHESPPRYLAGIGFGSQDASDRASLRVTVVDESKRSVELLLKAGADPNVTDAEGSTALHVICRRDDDNDNLMKMLFKICDDLEMPVDVDAQDNLRNTPLHLALAGGHIALTEVLLKQRADPNVKILTINQGGLLRASGRSLDSMMTFPEEVQVFSQDYPPGWCDRCSRNEFGLGDDFPRGSLGLFRKIILPGGAIGALGINSDSMMTFPEEV